MTEIIIDHGINDLVITRGGRTYIDFSSGFGSVILGHANPVVNKALKSQIDRIWIALLNKPSGDNQIGSRLRSFISEHYVFSQMYSTGMEALEFSLRVAAVQSGRKSYAGFERSMHGKSLAMSSLSWANEFKLDNFYTLPFIKSCSESEILEQTEKLFKSRRIAGLFIEPIQGSTGGLEATRGFYQQIISLCKNNGVVSIVDEVLTGFYRAGHASYCAHHNISPDIIVFGKSIGNGFPVSIVAVKDHIHLTSAMLPSSTYSSNPLACSAVHATLAQMLELNISEKVQQIHQCMLTSLKPLEQQGYTVRGKGALWFIEPPDLDAAPLAKRINELGTLTASTPTHLRLMPTATITETNLSRALGNVLEACELPS